MNKQLDTKQAQTKPELYTVLVAGLTMEEYLKKQTAPKTITFWGTKYEFTPYLLDEIIGDGLQLCYLGSINSRPHYWLIRIDSKTDVSSDDFDFEDLLQPIEEECGRCDDDGCERCEENGTECEYPAISWGGGHWGMVANFATGQEGS